MLLGADTFLGVRADSWAAVGIFLTLVVYAVIAVVAISQLAEARRLRREQTRPFVLVDVNLRSIMMELMIRNIGTTAARDVQVTFDVPLESSRRDPDWQYSSAFTDGIPMMAPGRRIRFFWDTYPSRDEEGLPMVVTGSVAYSGPTGRYEEAFVLDLTVYGGAAVEEKALPDLVKAVENIEKTLEKWSQGKGIRVSALDLDRAIARENRPMRVSQSIKAKNDEGWLAAARVWVHSWQERFGWHQWG